MLDGLCMLAGHSRSYAARKPRQANGGAKPEKGQGDVPEALWAEGSLQAGAHSPLVKAWTVMGRACGRRAATGTVDVAQRERDLPNMAYGLLRLPAGFFMPPEARLQGA